MAILKQRLNRKNSSGTYDTIYLETAATVVKMSETDSTKLSDKISSMDTAIAGKQPKGSYAAASHTHDDRYYTETEVNSLVSGRVKVTGWDGTNLYLATG